MYGVGGSQAIASVLFAPACMHSDGEFMKNREFSMDSDFYQQQNQQSSGLMRYSSAPGSFFFSLMDDGGECEDLFNSIESDSISTRFMASSGSSADSNSRDLQFPANVKHEAADHGSPPEENGYSMSASQTVYQQSPPGHELASSVSTHSAAWSSGLYEVKSGGGNSSNPMRQSSSLEEFFSSLNVENGLPVMRDVGSFNDGTGKASPPTSRMGGHLNFSSGASSSSGFMPRIAESGNEGTGPSGPESRHLGNSDGYHLPEGFQNDSRSNSSAIITGLKRSREGDDFSSFDALKNQDGGSSTCTTGLTHHLSLPKTSAEMAAMEKFLQFQQDSVPCKIRAKRGCATHPRSIAERMRRARISERMRKLQELFPNLDKTNTADMLDLAVEHIKDLQKQVQTLTDARARCACSIGRRRQLPDSSA